ncbi:MAG: S9 family peptidase [Acidobacteria bacterium]|nr:MAG: S9 family peptidase [Acidobacteriota bacterium]REK06166.1 MAG: S9 family peptidase [Acidobacteriota bacterium]
MNSHSTRLGPLVAWAAALATSLLATETSATGPASSDAIRERVARFARITSCRSPALSPDGQTLAFVADISGTPQIWKVPSRGGWPTQVTALDDTVAGVSWSPDGERLAVSAAPGGGMNSQVYLVSPDGFDVERITSGGSEMHRIGRWSASGRFLPLSSNARDPAAMDGYLYDVEEQRLDLAAEIGGFGGILDLAEQQGAVQRLLITKLEGRGSNDLYLRELGDDGATLRELLLTEHQGPGSFDGELSSDGRTVWVAGNQESDRITFGRIEVDGEGESVSASPITVLRARSDADLESFAVSPDERVAALVWNVAGRSELELYGLESGASQPVQTGGADLVGSLEWSADARMLVFTVAGAALPANVFGLDPKTGRGALLTNCPHPGVDLAELVRPELVTFNAHDGLELSGWLYRPKAGDEGQDEAKPPYVLSFHGGPEGQERPTLRSDYQALLAEGIGVFAPNIRGSSGFGKRFVNLDNRELRVDANRDIEASARHLVESGIADPERLGIMGGSYGGYAVMVGVTDYPELFAAGVNLFGMVNFETFFANTEPWMAAISGTEYGDPETQKELLRQLSPIHRLDRVRTPLLVLHGANDTNVPVVEAEQVVENLERRGVPVEYVLFPDEGHGFRKAPNRLTSTVKTVEWFVRHLAD